MSEEYGPDWVRVTLMIYPNNAGGISDIHAIGGDREPGEGDTKYIGLEIIKSLRAEIEALENEKPDAAEIIELRKAVAIYQENGRKYRAEIEALHTENSDKSQLLARFLGESEKLKAEIEALRNPWVSVDERLPEDGEVVEAANFGRLGRRFIGQYSIKPTMGYIPGYQGTFTSWLHEAEDYAVVEYVTHWMPLPAPPDDQESP